jgi:hypothetical protein
LIIFLIPTLNSIDLTKKYVSNPNVRQCWLYLRQELIKDGGMLRGMQANKFHKNQFVKNFVTNPLIPDFVRDMLMTTKWREVTDKNYSNIRVDVLVWLQC